MAGNSISAETDCNQNLLYYQQSLSRKFDFQMPPVFEMTVAFHNLAEKKPENDLTMIHSYDRIDDDPFFTPVLHSSIKHVPKTTK